MDIKEEIEETRTNRRRLSLLLLLLLVIGGAGIGTLVGDSPDPPNSPPVVDATPVDPTPTPTPTPGSGPTPTETASPPPETGTPGDTSSPTPTPTSPTQTPTSPTPTPTITEEAPDESGGGGSGGGGSGGGSSSPVTLKTVGTSVVLDYDNVAPGDSGRESMILRNAGSVDGRIFVTDVLVDDAENGIVGPEGNVDSSPNDGELSDNVEIVLEVHSPDGSVDYLYGTGSGARPLSTIDGITSPQQGQVLAPGEEAEIVVDWEVPPSTGNEIQSDGLEMDIEFELRED